MAVGTATYTPEEGNAAILEVKAAKKLDDARRSSHGEVVI
jgi:hypothetical protein